MGSSGSGRLTDYPGSGENEKPTSEDRCNRAFSVTLEDIEHSEFFKSHGSVPEVGTNLQIAHQKRIVAEAPSGEVVGNLPTKFNYLASCIAAGFKYVGKVVDSASGPATAKVTVDFAPILPK